MKRLVFLTLSACLTIALGASFTRSFEYPAAAVQLGSQDGYTTVDFGMSAHISNLGEPDLPCLPYQVAIPADAEVTGLEIVSFKEEALPGTYKVLPAQHPIPWKKNYEPKPFVPPDPLVYSQNKIWPENPARFAHVGSMSGYRIASFLIYPVRYNPVEGRLYLVSEITVRLNYETGRHHTPAYTEMQLKMFGDQVKHLVLNPEDVDRFAPPKRTGSFGSRFLEPGNYEHVIMTSQQFADSLVWLRDWRTRLGWRSKIVILESICATYPGRDNAEKMRNFIKDADTTWGTIFVFIARPDYPANYYRVARSYGYDFFSDMYFSDLDGTWDRNNNNIFGELADSVDGYADVHVGMMTLNQFSEIANVRSKIIRYETAPDTTGGWWNKILLPNGVTFSDNYNDSIANASPTPPWFDLKMYYSGNGQVQPTPQRYCDSLNSGYTFNSVIAHGSPDLYDLNGSVTSQMMINLTNTNRLNCITAVSCNVGQWDLGSTNGDCIAENMFNHAPNGFIGVMMNYESGWVNVAEKLNYAIGYGFLGFRTARKIYQGEMISYGRNYWVPVILDSQKYRMEIMERNLFGEPATPIWRARPFVPVVSKPGAINIGNNIPVTITVQTPGFAPVESAMVVLQKPNETFVRGWTNASGQVTLLVSCLTPGFLKLAISGASNIPYLDSIVVMSSGRYVSYLRHYINDAPPGGNGDSIINPGESFRIPMWVKNYGSLTANSVTARLRTHTAGVTITDSVKSFGNIAGNDSAFNAQGFGMTVASGLPNRYPINCSLVCKDALDSTWISLFTLYVGAPSIVFVNHVVKDSTGSQPNGRLDPNETADLEITLSNSGLGNAYNVRALLRSGDPRMSVTDSEAVYGNIPAGASATNFSDHFTVYASSAILPETPIPCTLYISADNGYASTAAFTIIVGEIRQVDPVPDNSEPPLYWAYDEVDILYPEHPTFEWVEIYGIGTRLSLTDDQTVQISLPPAFGPFIFYGQSYNQISICSNGWIAPGYTTVSTWSNTALPNTEMPPLIAANWDDLYPPYGDSVWYYHDAANHRFIIEWDSVHYFSSSEWEKFEIILYDTTYAAEDGNSKFVIQYLTANRAGSSATVGIQDHTKTKYIQMLFDGTYHRGASPWVPGHAIKFSSDNPTGIAEDYGTTLLKDGRILAVAPSLFRRTTVIRYQIPQDGSAELRVFDASGRIVRTLVNGRMKAGTYTASWNGTDDNGSRVASGIYFIRLTTPETSVKVKTVLNR
ncbi:MAG: C25 family cysteine peptidase [candidate division WOR-3 bacterium]